MGGNELISGYIAIGGNIGDVESTIISALKQLTDLPIIEVIAVSPLYLNAAVGGPCGQPVFLYCFAAIRTGLVPDVVLERCLMIERRLGRERIERWGPRVIDLDLVLYGDTAYQSAVCVTPHPRLRERPFVLVPLLDVAPSDLAVPPDGKSLIEIVNEALAIDRTSLEEYHKKRV